MASVSVVAGEDRAAIVRAALDRLPAPPQVAGARRIVVKPNVVSTVRPLAATHVQALRAVLEWLRDQGASSVTVADGSAADDTLDGFRALSYFELADIPGLAVHFVDLNRDQGVPLTIYTRELEPRTIQLARTIVESDLRISVTRPKTHDAVIVTGALKNMLMGSPINRLAGGPRWRSHLIHSLTERIPPRFRSIQGLASLSPTLASRLALSDKAAVHQGAPVINLNLFLLARLVAPHLGVLDGVVGMQGSGPIYGDPVALGWAAASTDAVALDTIMAILMGHDPASVGYLHYCARAGLGVGDSSEIDVIGPPLGSLQRLCRPSSTIDAQLRWQDAQVEQLFQTELAATGTV